MPVDLTTYTGIDLIPADDRNEFRAAMMDIKATFHKTPVLYRVAQGVLSRFNESRREETKFVDHNLDGFVEFSQLVEDKYIWTTDGAVAEARIRVTFNVDYLDQQGLWDNTTNTVKWNGKADMIILKGKEYRITEIPVYEGPLEDRTVHVIMYAEPADKKTT